MLYTLIFLSTVDVGASHVTYSIHPVILVDEVPSVLTFSRLDVCWELFCVTFSFFLPSQGNQASFLVT